MREEHGIPPEGEHGHVSAMPWRKKGESLPSPPPSPPSALASASNDDDGAAACGARRAVTGSSDVGSPAAMAVRPRSSTTTVAMKRSGAGIAAGLEDHVQVGDLRGELTCMHSLLTSSRHSQTS